jgi:hypothetical protein
VYPGQLQIDRYEELICENLDFVEVDEEDEADGQLFFTASQIRGLASKAHMIPADKLQEIIDNDPTLSRLDMEIRTHDSSSGGSMGKGEGGVSGVLISSGIDRGMCSDGRFQGQWAWPPVGGCGQQRQDHRQRCRGHMSPVA